MIVASPTGFFEAQCPHCGSLEITKDTGDFGEDTGDLKCKACDHTSWHRAFNPANHKPELSIRSSHG